MLKPRRDLSCGRRVFVECRSAIAVGTVIADRPRTDCMGLFLSRGFSAGHLLFLSSLSQFLFFSSSAPGDRQETGFLTANAQTTPGVVADHGMCSFA